MSKQVQFSLRFSKTLSTSIASKPSKSLIWRSTGMKKPEITYTVPLRKGLEDLPVPGNKWKILENFLLPGNKDLKTLYNSINEGPPFSIYRLPLPFTPWPLVFVRSIEYVDLLMKNEGSLPKRREGELCNFMKRKGLGAGMFISNWEEWQTLRSKATPQVIPRRITEFVSPICQVADDLINHLLTERGLDGNVFDIREPMINWAMEGMGVFLFGKRLEMLNNPTSKMLQLRKSGITFVEGLAPLFTFPQLFKYFPTPRSVGFEKAIRCQQKILKELIEDKIAHLVQAVNTGNVAEHVKVDNFLDQWLRNDNISSEDILILTRELLAIGTETTSTAATYMLFELAKNQEVQEKLKLEILTAIGPQNPPSAQNIQKLPYAKNIIKETLRYHPINRGTLRHLPEETQFGEYLLPKETVVVIPALAFNHNSSIFKDPHIFNPDRWEDKELMPYSNLPFGLAGPRACYGRRAAEFELLILLIKVAQKIHLETDQQSFQVKGTTVLKPVEPIRLKISQNQ